ncbi:hypothetical protein TWF730_008278 [Orbilia blumenaviensis]|uniref:Uncharacterized protein n=1 Tax=Orbilia blumenaviensis TaxID=1796055 RepID=A0AAV9V207_9PEZI
MSLIAVLSMFGSFVAGVAVAAGHHFFYLSHEGQLVGTSTDQEWVLRISTGLTFLVRFLYSFSLGIVLVQLFWGRFQSVVGTTMGTADRVFEIRTSPAALFDLGFWAFSPIMAFHGIIYWLLPLAFVVAPSSLTIALRGSSDGQALVYEYHRRSLFLSYFIPGVLVFIGCIVGVINIMGSTRAYSSTLSTVIRTSGNETLDRLIEVADRSGGDPLPKRLAKIKVRLAVLYGTSVALDGENFAIEIAGSAGSGRIINNGTRHAPRGSSEDDEGRLAVQRVVEGRDSELENLPAAGSQDYHSVGAKAKDRPILLGER